MKISVGIIQQGLEVVVQVEDANDVVNAALVDRDPGESGLTGSVIDLLAAVLDIHGHDVHPGCHDLGGADLVEVQSVLQQLTAVLVQDVLILGGLDDGLQLLHGVVLLAVFLPLQGQGHEADKSHHQKRQGLEDDGQEAHRPGKGQRETVGVLLRHDLWHGLAEDDNADRHDDSGDPGILLSEGGNGDERAQGGDGDVHEIVADEDGGEGIVVMVDDPDRQGRQTGTVLSLIFQADAVGGGERHLSAGKERGEGQADERPDKIGGHASSLPSGRRWMRSCRMRRCWTFSTVTRRPL